MCKDLHSTSVARRDTIPAQRRETPATCREPCLPNRHPSPDTATAASISRCGTIPAQRHISAQPAGTKARRLVRTSQEDAHKGSQPPHNLAPTLLLPRGSMYTYTIQAHAGCDRERDCTSVTSLRRCRSLHDKTGAGSAKERVHEAPPAAYPYAHAGTGYHLHYPSCATYHLHQGEAP
jgi:hypothetical protein